MITYNECLQLVGVNKMGNAPKQGVEYIAYKNGEVRRFANEKEAKAFSSLIERVVTNQDEIDTYWATMVALQSEAGHIFENFVKEELAPDMSKELWDLCWYAAYEESHSSGYDEIALSVRDFIRFAEKVLAIHTQSEKTK